MSKTVGYTSAIATEMLLLREIPPGLGLLLPTSKEVYIPILDRMGDEQIAFTKNCVRHDKVKTSTKLLTACNECDF